MTTEYTFPVSVIGPVGPNSVAYLTPKTRLSEITIDRMAEEWKEINVGTVMEGVKLVILPPESKLEIASE